MGEQIPVGDSVVANALATQQLATATAVGRLVPVAGGKEIHVRPLKYKQTILTLQKIPPLLSMIRKMQEDGVEEIGLTEFLAVAPTTLEQIALMCCAELSPQWFEEASTDDALSVLTAVWEVNQDFFGKSVLPKLKALGLDAAFGKLKQLGSNESTSS